MGEGWGPWKFLGSLNPTEGEAIGTSSLPGVFGMSGPRRKMIEW